MARKIKIFLVILVLILLVVGAVKLVKKKKARLAKLPTPQEAPLPVETARVRLGELEVTEHYLGEIRPLLEAYLSSRLTGYLLAVTKYEGDPVEKGELLARIDDQGLKAKLKSLTAQLEAARTSYRTRQHIFARDKVLFENKALSQEAFELSRAALAEAKARVLSLEEEIAAVKNDLTYAEIRAPFSGIVTKRLKEPGDLVLPGQSILALEDPSRGYRVLVRVPEHRAASFSMKTAYLIEGGKRAKVSVYRVHPATAPGGLATVEIRTTRRPFNLPSGARIGVDLVVKRVHGALVPLRALLENVKTSYVFRIIPEKDGLGKVEPVAIKVLGRSGEMVAVAGPLREGDLVVVAEESTLLRLQAAKHVLPVRE
jgi:RND family efflux transporter MFP subunit